MKIVAIVPIKLNNERLPGKNTKMLGDKPLISYCQETLLAAGSIDEIYVFCSSGEIKSCLLPGVHFLRRPDKLDLPSANFTQIFDVFRHEVAADVYVYAHATAPFITAATIEREIEAVTAKGYDSAFCAEKIQDFVWKDGAPLNFDAAGIPRSQDLPVLWRETSGVYVFRKEVFSELRRRVGINPYIAEVGRREAVDINTAEDFRFAQILLDLDKEERAHE